MHGSFSFTSGEIIEDGIEGKPELELLVELVGDGTLEVESDGKLEGGEGVHFNSLFCSIIQFCGWGSDGSCGGISAGGDDSCFSEVEQFLLNSVM